MGESHRFFDLSRTEKLKVGLNRYLKKSGISWMLKHSDIVETWNAAAGEAIASQTKIRSFRGGVLHVDVYNTVLKAELEQFNVMTLVRIMQELLPAAGIRKIRFHLGEKPAKP